MAAGFIRAWQEGSAKAALYAQPQGVSHASDLSHELHPYLRADRAG
jgi:hypothetical protein